MEAHKDGIAQEYYRHFGPLNTNKHTNQTTSCRDTALTKQERTTLHRASHKDVRWIYRATLGRMLQVRLAKNQPDINTLTVREQTRIESSWNDVASKTNATRNGAENTLIALDNIDSIN